MQSRRFSGRGKGDQLVRLIVDVPKNLTARQKELLREFEKESGSKVPSGDGNKSGFFGKKKQRWVHKTCKMPEFLKDYKEMVEKGEATVEDLSISKLALMAIGI